MLAEERYRKRGSRENCHNRPYELQKEDGVRVVVEKSDAEYSERKKI